MVKSLLIMASLFSMSALHALEIDEKLTLRFLKVSNSKKTVLINRGAEDGLSINDHAKFFITTGVIARGVAEKVSPSRSVWSLYRVVDPAEITDGKVLNLKISSPVKITEDPSKSMKEEAIPSGSDKMSMKNGDAEVEAAGAPVLKDADQKELEGLGIEDNEKPLKNVETGKKVKKLEVKEVSLEESPAYESNNAKNWEVFGTLYVNALSGKTTTPSSSAGSESIQSNSASSSGDYSAGIERYFTNTNSFLKNASLNIFVHKRSVENDVVGQPGASISVDCLEFGGSGSYHFYNPAGSVGKLIGYGSLSGGFGSLTIIEKTLTLTNEEKSTTISGSDVFFTVGIGAKYNLANGLGLRATLDYYHATETYASVVANSDLSTTRTLGGPRIQLGLTYRF